MAYASRAADNSAKWAAVAIGFSVPVSVALDNMLMPAVLLLWLIGGNLREKYQIIKRNPVALAALSLIGWLAIGMFYGNAPVKDALDAFGKYIDLLFVPVFVTIFRENKTKRQALDAFVFAMLLTLLLSYLLKFGILHQGSILRGFNENPYVFKLHITQNFFMSYCTLILAVRFFMEKEKRMLWGTLALLSLFNVLFMVQGRTGYVVMALLLLYLFANRMGKRGLILGLAATILLGSLAFYGSNEFHKRMTVAMSEFTQWHRNDATVESDSIGQRLEFYTNTIAIVRAHPVLGVGTGGFPAAYREQVAGTKMIPSNNPHEEFLLVASQTGLMGLGLLLLLFVVQWREATKLPGAEKMLAHGLVISMVSGCLFNSFLLDHAEGLFFAFMSGVLFSERNA